MTTREQAPFKATIVLDVWSYERERAAEIVEQLVREIEFKVTNERGGFATHHYLVSVSLERQ